MKFQSFIKARSFIVDGHFPNHPVRHEEGEARPVMEVPEFTKQEFVATVKLQVLMSFRLRW